MCFRHYTMSTKLDYKFKVITKDDTEAVLEHLRKFFFANEPVNTAARLIDDENPTCLDLEKYCLDAMYGGISYIAVTDTKKIVSVNLNSIHNIDDVDEEAEYLSPRFEPVGKYLNFVGGNGTKAIIEKFPECKKILDIKVLSTDFEWRGKGIAGALTELARKAAYEKGCDLIRMDCSNYYSTRVAEKLGFELVYELPYKDYKENGKPVFDMPHPHTSATTYVQKLVQS